MTDLIDESIAIGLAFLWLCLAVAFGLSLTGDIDNGWVLLGIIGVGFLGAARMSGRDRWWLHGAAVFIAFVLLGLLFGWLRDAGYPPSTFGIVPFAAGAAARWEMFGLLLAIALAAGIAVRAPTPIARLGRTGLAGLVALGYLIAWTGGQFPNVSAGQVVVALTLVLAAIGLGDMLTTWASRRGHDALAAAVSVPAIALTLLVVGAAIVWRLWLGTPVDPLAAGGPEQNDALSLGTLAVLLVGSAIVSALAIRKLPRRD